VTHFPLITRIALPCCALALATVAGCACCNTCEEPLANYSYRHHGPCYFGPLLCFGYHSTCWRPWPEECPPCPPFTLTPEMVEPVAPVPRTLPDATLPSPGGEIPSPMPATPSPSDRGYYSTPDEREQRPQRVHMETGFASEPVRLAPLESH
jgi:hypothetical protein